MKIKNEFSYSPSRDRLFKECKRGYYYHYYYSFGGWEYNAKADIRKAYILKNQTNMYMLVGEIIHNAIEEILHLLGRNELIEIDKLIQMVQNRFQRCWNESRNKLWLKNPKKYTNLFEHYYSIEISNEKILEIQNLLTTCITNFYISDLFKFIKSVHPYNWLKLEKMDWFKFEDIKVYAKPDFVIKYSDKILIYDWKSGKELEQDLLQCVCYLLYSNYKWGIDPTNIIVYLFYLPKGAVHKIDISVEQIEKIKNEMKESINEMLNLLDDKEENKASINNFNKTKDLWRCNNCSFKELCYENISIIQTESNL